jgi:hypothetical protein
MDTRLSGLATTEEFEYNALRHTRGKEKVKKKLSVGFVLLIVLVLAVATALAMNYSYVLEYLFGASTEKAELYETSVQNIGIVHDGSGVKTIIKDALWDETTISVGIGFETSEPIYIVTDAISVNGTDCEAYTSSVEDQWVGTDLFGNDENQTAIHGFSVRLPADIVSNGSVTINLRLKLMQPQSKIHFIDVYADDTIAMWNEIDTAVANGETPVDQDEPFPVLVSSEWFGDEFNDEWGAQYPLNAATEYAAYSNMVIIDTVDITFTLNAP